MLSKIKILIIPLLIFGLVFFGGVARAQYQSLYQSNNYKVDQTFFGAGGNFGQSTNYQSHSAAGELAVGNISSPNFQAYAGFNTTSTILLEVSVNGGDFDLGTLDQAQAKAQTTTFSVRDYLSTGYTVQLLGRPPSNSGHELAAMASAGASSPGTEQFGINLTANNLSGVGPFGAAPQQLPDSTFGFGQAVSPYGTANLFKFVEGDTVAQSLSSSGVTLYTLSVIENISRVTPGGSYGGSLFVRVVPTF